MGRPKDTDPTHRIVTLTVRITPAEREILDRRRGEQSITDYVRDRVFADDQET